MADLLMTLRAMHGERRSASIRSETIAASSARNDAKIALARLAAIQSAQNPTAAQVTAAVQDLAAYQEKIIRAVLGGAA